MSPGNKVKKEFRKFMSSSMVTNLSLKQWAKNAGSVDPALAEAIKQWKSNKRSARCS